MQYQNLKNHIRSHIGPNKKYDAIPLENKPQKSIHLAQQQDFYVPSKRGQEYTGK